MSVGVLMAALIAWMTANSDMAAPEYGARVEIRTPEQLWYMFNPGQEFPEDPANGRVHGLYQADTIYLSTDCPLTDVFCQSVVLHELVHHYQDYGEGELVCYGQREREAYLLQQKWLEQRGVDIWDHLDPLYTMMVWQVGCGPHGEGVR